MAPKKVEGPINEALRELEEERDQLARGKKEAEKLCRIEIKLRMAATRERDRLVRKLAEAESWKSVSENGEAIIEAAQEDLHAVWKERDLLKKEINGVLDCGQGAVPECKMRPGALCIKHLAMMLKDTQDERDLLSKELAEEKWAWRKQDSTIKGLREAIQRVYGERDLALAEVGRLKERIETINAMIPQYARRAEEAKKEKERITEREAKHREDGASLRAELSDARAEVRKFEGALRMVESAVKMERADHEKRFAEAVMLFDSQVEHTKGFVSRAETAEQRAKVLVDALAELKEGVLLLFRAGTEKLIPPEMVGRTCKTLMDKIEATLKKEAGGGWG
jgi:chromosome segregation ATPase